jgi:hypothetical protein
MVRMLLQGRARLVDGDVPRDLLRLVVATKCRRHTQDTSGLQAHAVLRPCAAPVEPSWSRRGKHCPVWKASHHGVQREEGVGGLLVEASSLVRGHDLVDRRLLALPSVAILAQQGVQIHRHSASGARPLRRLHGVGESEDRFNIWANTMQ